MKAGIFTTEFWLTVGGFLVTAIAVIFSLPSNTTADLQQAVAGAITAVVALITQIWLVVAYVQGRSTVKAMANMHDDSPRGIK